MNHSMWSDGVKAIYGIGFYLNFKKKQFEIDIFKSWFDAKLALLTPRIKTIDSEGNKDAKMKTLWESFKLWISDT